MFLIPSEKTGSFSKESSSFFRYLPVDIQNFLHSHTKSFFTFLYFEIIFLALYESMEDCIPDRVELFFHFEEPVEIILNLNFFDGFVPFLMFFDFTVVLWTVCSLFLTVFIANFFLHDNQTIVSLFLVLPLLICCFMKVYCNMKQLVDLDKTCASFYFVFSSVIEVPLQQTIKMIMSHFIYYCPNSFTGSVEAYLAYTSFPLLLLMPLFYFLFDRPTPQKYIHPVITIVLTFISLIVAIVYSQEVYYIGITSFGFYIIHYFLLNISIGGNGYWLVLSMLTDFTFSFLERFGNLRAVVHAPRVFSDIDLGLFQASLYETNYLITALFVGALVLFGVYKFRPCFKSRFYRRICLIFIFLFFVTLSSYFPTNITLMCLVGLSNGLFDSMTFIDTEYGNYFISKNRLRDYFFLQFSTVGLESLIDKQVKNMFMKDSLDTVFLMPLIICFIILLFVSISISLLEGPINTHLYNREGVKPNYEFSFFSVFITNTNFDTIEEISIA